jgi:carbon-monoxide dehydrogenase small subunit
MKHPIRLKVNGDVYELSVDSNEILIDVLRNRLDLTGTKEGCGAGDCGACTVMIDGRSVNSCLMLAVEAEGRDILTIEGVAKDGKLDPVQKAFIDEGAIQCGFCTPGMVLSTKALLEENPYPTEEDIRKSIAGNICRCTGYQKIVRAIQEVSRKR